jgi:hypothetical protein
LLLAILHRARADCIEPERHPLGAERIDPAVATAREAAALLMPRPSLSSLIACLVVRDTRERPLEPDKRYNFYPASPLCGVTWVLAGSIHLVGGDGHIEPSPVPHVCFFGPTREPTASWSDGPNWAATIALYPDSCRALSGQHVTPSSNRTVRLEDAMDAALAKIFADVEWADGCKQGFLRLQDALEPLWRDRRKGAFGPPAWLADWLRLLTVRAAQTGSGSSRRQVQRRIKTWTGFADLAAAMGYADQSHLGRDVKRVTGHSPAKIAELIQSDERFWFYRLMSEQFFTN